MLSDEFLQGFEELFGGFGEDLVFLPGEEEGGFHLRLKGAEGEFGIVVPYQFVYRHRITHACAHHERGVVEKVVGGDDVELGKIVPQPPGELVGEHRLARTQERQRGEVGRTDAVVRSEFAVAAHEQSPRI